MTENEIAKQVVDAAFRVHTHFGPGLYEIVYEVSLVHELKKRGLACERQVAIGVEYDSIRRVSGRCDCGRQSHSGTEVG